MRLSSKQKVRCGVSMMLSFLLALLLFAGVLVGVLYTTLMQPVYMKTKIQESGFAAQVVRELTESFTSFGAASGFSVDPFAQVLREDLVQVEIESSIDVLYGQPRETQTTAFSDQLTQSLMQNVADRSITITDEITLGIKELVKISEEQYKAHTKIPFLSFLAKALNQVRGKILLTAAFLLGTVVFASVFLCVLNRSAAVSLRYHIYALTTSVLMLGVLGGGMLLSRMADRIGITPLSMNRFIAAYANGIFIQILLFACGLAILLVALALFYAIAVQHEKRRCRIK